MSYCVVLYLCLKETVSLLCTPSLRTQTQLRRDNTNKLLKIADSKLSVRIASLAAAPGTW